MQNIEPQNGREIFLLNIGTSLIVMDNIIMNLLIPTEKKILNSNEKKIRLTEK